MEKNSAIPILVPFEPIEFWAKIREIIREEICRNAKEQCTKMHTEEASGLTEKPLYKIHEVCTLFKVTKPTIYDWIRHGKLKPKKIRSRVYFLGSDIRQLIQF